MLVRSFCPKFDFYTILFTILSFKDLIWNYRWSFEGCFDWSTDYKEFNFLKKLMVCFYHVKFWKIISLFFFKHKNLAHKSTSMFTLGICIAFLILIVSENLPPLYVYIINCCHEDTYALPETVITYKLCSLYLKRSQYD